MNAFIIVICHSVLVFASLSVNRITKNVFQEFLRNPLGLLTILWLILLRVAESLPFLIFVIILHVTYFHRHSPGGAIGIDGVYTLMSASRSKVRFVLSAMSHFSSNCRSGEK